MRKYLERKGWWDDAQEAAVKKESRQAVLKAFNLAETQKKPPIKDLFTDVYDSLPPHLEQQQQEMLDMIKKYPDQYPTKLHAEQ